MEQPSPAAAPPRPIGGELQWTPDPADPAGLSPGQRVGRYTVVARLGHGAHAVAYRVHAEGVDYALKVLSKADEGLRERVLQEGEIQARLRHPNTVAVREAIQIGPTVGLVMDYVAGPTLHVWLRAERPDIPTALAIFRGVAEGVGAAHALGIVHRDIKPGNVLMQLGPGLPTPRVCDFGLAKVEDPTGAPTDEGRSMGTPGYMAPEQIVDWGAVDRRADIFSLGCVLYELLAGRRPFRGGDARAMCEAILAGQYPPPEALIPEIPEHLRVTIRRCLATERLRRPPTCAVLLRLLEDPSPERIKAPGTLAERLGGEPMTLVEGVKLVSAVAEQLSGLHAENRAHGDLRPSKILLEGPRILPAEPFNVERPGPNEQLAHLAPEHLREEPIGPAADQYGLATLLVAALHGGALGLDALFDTRHLLLRLEGPPQVLRVLARALSADPAQRHESVAAFVQALGAATADAIARPGGGDELREEELLAVDGELPRLVEKDAPPWRLAILAALVVLALGGFALSLGQEPAPSTPPTEPTWSDTTPVEEGSLLIRLSDTRALATLRCSGGRQAAFHGQLRLRYLKPADCVIEVGGAEGKFTVRAPGEVRCNVTEDQVSCAPVAP